MSTLHTSLTLPLLLAASFAGAADQLSPELQRGLFEEEANQNFDAAIKAYQSVLTSHDNERKLAATALFRLGECYRKLGRTNDAIAQYRRLVADFEDQAALANLSRQNLIGLGARATSTDGAGDTPRTGDQVLLQERALAAQMAEARRLETLVKQLQNQSRSELRRVLPTLAPDELLNGLLQQLSQEEQTLFALSSTKAAEHPEVKAVRNKIAVLQSQIDERIEGVVQGLKLKAEALARESETLKKELASLPTARRTSEAGTDNTRADPAARAQLKELLQGEIKIAEQFGAEQRKKVEVGTLAKGDEVRFERDVLNLKRQLIAVDGLASAEDRSRWRELLLQEIKLAEDAVRSEKQKLDSGKSVASEVARLQRDVLILKRELVTFDATPADAAETAAPRQRLQVVVDRPALTDEEEKEIRRIQALIRDSPDLINAASDGMTPLQRAAWNGQLVVARFLLENGANVDQASGDGKTALMRAATYGHKSMVELLLAKGANLNAKGEYGNTALHEAAAKGFVTVVDVLLANKAELESRNLPGETPLHRAVSAGQAAVVETLLKRGADPNTPRTDGDTPLHLAASRGDVRTIQLLLKYKADINAKNKSGVPPLGDALARGGTVEAVQTLLENGATTDFVQTGGSPVHPAVARESVELVQLLLKHKAASDRPNSRGLTPLQSVVIDQRKPELIPLLIKAGANPNSPLPASAKMTIRERTGSRDQSLPQYPILIAAIIRRDLPQVEALLANGADVNAIAPDGDYQSTALMFAIYYDSLELVEALLRYKPNLELRTKRESRTALHQATTREEKPGVDFVEALIKAGAKIDATDDKGWTPLHIAAYDGKVELVRILLQAGANPNLHANDGALPLSLARRFSGRTVLSETVRQEISTLLLEHGADESLLRRRTIAVTRRGKNFEKVIFRKGTNDFNRHTLYELIADIYGPDRNDQQYVSFPDLRQIAIERVDGASRTRQILVDVESRAAEASCTNDLSLEWGDRVEIRESEHPLTALWPGLEGTIATNISRCLERRVELVVKGRKNRLDLRATPISSRPAAPGGKYVNAHHITQDSFRLGEVLRRSGLLLTTSDLTHIRVHRRDPVTSKEQEWIIDETKPDPETDLWVRDGDVIEVPEK